MGREAKYSMWHHLSGTPTWLEIYPSVNMYPGTRTMNADFDSGLS